uniref:NADH-ubiquinone oxidoreductase chain 4 n=1 Tax=Streptocephalus sirindhornae TaxID=91588 RepID=A0A0U1Z3C3_9CRUS|nr:NADH dehydrogenase subunit 4 [Streptocephalus sirindhornae]AJP09642.1 NADH dehydrogenase subunit 4 [Streptocephalus sirindhornae]
MSKMFFPLSFSFLGIFISLSLDFSKSWSWYLLTLTMWVFLLMIFSWKTFSLNTLSLDFSKSWSWYLLTLTMWVFLLMIFSWKPFSLNMYTLLLVTLFSLLILTFTSSSLISFYIFFESSLIPTMLLIMGWGYQPERLPSSLYFLFYTLVASLPLLFIILGLNYEHESSVTFFLPSVSDETFQLFMVLAFLVKLPIYFGHIWLPKAHVEAPVTGSMVLAAILLKLGGYGLYLVQPLINESEINVILIISLLGGLYSSILSLRQTDVKALIAYSSVAHMSMVILAMLLSNIYLNVSSISMMIAHGVCSSGLFYMSYLIYTRLSSRSFLITRGVLVLLPYLSLWWFLLIVFNMGVPPSFNFFAELYSFIGVSSVNMLYMGFVGLISFFSACYCLYLYSSSSHGMNLPLLSFSESSVLELFVASAHFLPLLLLIGL